MMHGKMGKVSLAGVAPQFHIRLSGIALSKIDARWSVETTLMFLFGSAGSEIV